MDPHGKPIDVVGIVPRVKVAAKPDDFNGKLDPVLAAALENLWKRMRTENPPSGGVLQRPAGVPQPKDRPRGVSVFPSPVATDVRSKHGYLRGFCAWLIDTQSLLPAVCDGQYLRY